MGKGELDEVYKVIKFIKFVKFMKKIVIGIIVVCLFFLGGYKCYRHFRPKYVPLPPRAEVTITIIPGWDLKRSAIYLAGKGFTTSTKLSADLEGYLSPNTYRVYKDATLQDVIDKLKTAREEELEKFDEAIKKSGMSLKEVLTLASIIEKEANTPEDMKIVADIFLRRLEENWALQSCATVNYITGKNDPGISLTDKKIDSLYNTYKYPGLPPGPICNPSLDAIKAVLEPTKNSYVYFMAGDDGVMRYAEALEGHNLNISQYLH